MIHILSNQYVLLALTFAIFFCVRRLQLRFGSVLLNPILITIVALIMLLRFSGISYATYHAAGGIIDFWLKPAVVALGVPLYLQLEQIKRLWLPIVLSQMIGCLVGIVSVVVIARWFGASDIIIVSMAAKSVTTPIAMEVTQALNGIPSLTAAVVVITGILGAVMGFKTLAVGRVSSPIAQGLSMGTASHAVGTATAMTISAKYGAYASLGITLNGIFTALCTPTVLHWLM